MTASESSTDLRGLTAAEVAERVAAGKVNVTPDAHSRSFADIVRANTFTWFNGLIGSLWVVMLTIGLRPGEAAGLTWAGHYPRRRPAHRSAR